MGIRPTWEHTGKKFTLDETLMFYLMLFGLSFPIPAIIIGLLMGWLQLK